MTVTADSIRMRAGLEDLRAGFVERVGERCLAIENILAQAEGDRPTEAERHEIERHAHKTVGVAATFGYAALGARALEVERLLGPGRNPTWKAARPILDSFLDEMERILDAEA